MKIWLAMPCELSYPLKRHLYFAAEDNLKFCRFFKNNEKGMIFHENRLLADDSYKISYLIFLENLESGLKICRLLQL